MLSVDIGTRNLALCVAYRTCAQAGVAARSAHYLRWWCLHDLACGRSTALAIIQLERFLDSRAAMFAELTHVVIEGQQAARPIMQSLAAALDMYFRRRAHYTNTPLELQYMRGQQKLRVYDGPVTWKIRARARYEQNKQNAVEHCRALLGARADAHTYDSGEYADFAEALVLFESAGKQDDLADAYLQAVAALMGLAALQREADICRPEPTLEHWLELKIDL